MQLCFTILEKLEFLRLVDTNFTGKGVRGNSREIILRFSREDFEKAGLYIKFYLFLIFWFKSRIMDIFLKKPDIPHFLKSVACFVFLNL
jgi:hypothetical protein